MKKLLIEFEPFESEGFGSSQEWITLQEAVADILRANGYNTVTVNISD